MSLIFTRGSHVTVKTCLSTHRRRLRGRVLFINVSTLPNGRCKIRRVVGKILSTAFVCPAKNSGMMRITVSVLRGHPCRESAGLSATLISGAGTQIVRLRASRVARRSKGVRQLGGRIGRCLSECSTRAVFLCTYLVVLLLFTTLLTVVIHTC